MMTQIQTRLSLVRHGQTPWNVDGRWQGHGDPALTVYGRAQAERLAKDLSEGPKLEWTRVISSDLARASETAKILASKLRLPIEYDDRLRELDVGEWSGLTRAQIELRDPSTLAEFQTGEPNVRPGGGESRVEIRERAHHFIEDVIKRYAGEHMIVVTHLGVIRALLPGAEPNNADRIQVVAEELAARPVDRVRRAEDGVL